MSEKSKTLVVLAVWFGLPILSAIMLLVFDAYVYTFWGRDYTITLIMRRLHPLGVFFLGGAIFLTVGGLAFHFWFGPIQPPP